MPHTIGPYRRDRIVLCSADAHPKSQRQAPCEAQCFFPGGKWVGALRNAAGRLGCEYVILTTGRGMVNRDEIIGPYDVPIESHQAQVRRRWEATVPPLLGSNRFDILVFYAGGCPRDLYLKLLAPILGHLKMDLITFGRPNMFDVAKIEPVVHMLERGTSCAEIRSVLKHPERLLIIPHNDVRRPRPETSTSVRTSPLPTPAPATARERPQPDGAPRTSGVRGAALSWPRDTTRRTTRAPGGGTAQDDIQTITLHCRANLDLANARAPDEHYYQSLPLCVIDAVFSLNARYTGTRNTVIKFCEYFARARIRQSRQKLPDKTDQLSVREFIAIYDKYGVTPLAQEVYRNRQRTAPRGGILKSDAVLQFSQVLHRFGVDHLQDAQKVIGHPDFEAVIKTIPGQRRGISLRYFYMLAGSDDYIKPDRMVAAFVQSATSHSLSIDELHNVVVGACAVLRREHSHLTPRLLDYLIWNHQKQQQNP